MTSDLSAKLSNGSVEKVDVLSYMKFNIPQKQSALQSINEHFGKFSGLKCSARLLDFGCGEGTITQLLTYFSNIQEIHAVDVSKEMLTLGFCFNDHRKIVYHQSDLQKSSLTGLKHHFDIVTAFNSLHWIRDVSTVLENLRSMMKADAAILGVTLARSMPYTQLAGHYVMEHPQWIIESRKQAAPQSEDVCPWLKEYVDPKETFCRLLEEAGFAIDQVAIRPSKFYLTKTELLGFLSTNLLAFVPTLPKTLQSQYLIDVIDYLADPGIDSGIDKTSDDMYMLSAQLMSFCATNDCAD